MSNPVMRWQIISPESDQLAGFYTKLFGWEASRNNMMNYQMIDTASERGIDGGIWPAPAGTPSFVQLFIEVDDCAAYVASAGALGATVLMPPQALPDGDVMAILKDPAGMSFGIMQAAKV
ncbi:VOC family protein [Massilia sp. R2A-15]|uniref:VOC family protein n=1 Tax=Massilia sp. R2A-15 TaxID=3064278 RepID=UPI00273661A7|nr:VOC family protein [Massilia sp. R2A-15]WLI88583.1 VOC family protein [Massilia sp. R2A-15]